MVKDSKKERLMYKWIVFIILSSLTFYAPVFVPSIALISKYLLYGSVSLFLLYTAKRKPEGNAWISYVIVAISICQLLSAYNAYVFREQPLLIGVIATFQGFAFIVYLGLIKSKLGLRHAEKIIYLFGILFIIVSVVDRIYPLFGTWSMDVERGGMRFRLAGLTWVVLCFLMSINNFAEGIDKKRNQIIAILCLLAIVGTVTRQIIAVSLLMGGLLFLRKVSLYKKILFSIAVIFTIMVVLPRIPIFQKLSDATKEQISVDNRDTDIRVVAFYYLTFEPRDTKQVLFGMGIPSFGKSQYGNEFENFSKTTGIYREDLGYSGFYYNHGLIALLLVCVLMIASFWIPIPSHLQYLKYFMFGYMLMNIASGQIEGNDNIIPFVFALYMLNAFRYKKQNPTLVSKFS